MDSPLEQAGFEPSVPHLIGGVRRAIGKTADKLREDAGRGHLRRGKQLLRAVRTRPIGCARSRPQKAATAWSAGFLDLPKFTENNLPRLASSITSGAASKPATARTVQKGLGYATAKRKSGSARDRKGSGQPSLAAERGWVQFPARCNSNFALIPCGRRLVARSTPCPHALRPRRWRSKDGRPRQ